MDQAGPSTKASQPRIRRSRQPTVAQLANLGIKVRDFAYESTLPPVRTVYRQPRQIQPAVGRQLVREDTEPLDDQSQAPSGGPGLARSDTEPVFENEGPSLKREMGGFFDVDGSIVNSRVHLQTAGYAHMRPSVVSPDRGVLVLTPTATPNGSLKWDDAPLSGLSTPLESHLHPSVPGFSPLTPLTPSRQGSGVVLGRTPEMASLPKPFPKRRKISVDNDSRPDMNRFYLRSPIKPSLPLPPVVESSSSSASPPQE